MISQLLTPEGRAHLAATYRSALIEDVIPFWLRHGLDSEHGGIFTCLDRDGSIVDTDKSVWFQARAAWMFGTVAATESGPRDESIAAADSCIRFLRTHCAAPNGKLYFSVTREGRPLRMRRYVYSEAFASIALAACSKFAGGDAAAEAIRHFDRFLHHNFTPGLMPSKFDAARPMKGIGPLMIAIATAQELRAHLGDATVHERSCSYWIDWAVAEIEQDFLKPEHGALMETVAPDGSFIDHHEGRTLNPGHAIECAWFILHEARLRGNDPRLLRLGTTILDWMWTRGWDEQHGGLLYFTDVLGRPVQEYWHDMKFWWPHCEAILATLLAWRLTGEERFAARHQMAHDWSFRRFADPRHGEWFGYLHRDGSLASRAKGTLWKGPFHLPRMLWYCARELDPHGTGRPD